MAQRIVVKCRSGLIPGAPAQRNEKMASIICKHKWNREFDGKQDVFNSLGQYASDDAKCYFLLDNGPAGFEQPEIAIYRWDGTELKQRPVNRSIVNYLQHFPFGKQLTQQAGLSDEEYLALYGQTEFDKLVASRVEQRKRWGIHCNQGKKQSLPSTQKPGQGDGIS
ncbi:hypothetical protein LZ30DRAFT_743375 [Colletotrichum cereale]|nr:hypothetical protein LZ30DRAFT_743375 [Colletotrichum cereale]